MEPIPPKRMKTEEDASVEDGPQANGGESPDYFSDDVDYEMLIDEEFEGKEDSAEDSDSDSSASSTSQDAEDLNSSDFLKDVKPPDGKLGLQLEKEPDVSSAKIRGSAGEYVKVPDWSYHRSKSSKEFIKVEATYMSKVGQLNCSALLVHADLEIWLQNVGCLMLVDEGFIAKVAPINVEELRQATNFDQAKSVLLRQLRIVRIVLDDATTERDSRRAALLKLFDQIRLRIATCPTSAGDAVQILRIAENPSKILNYCELCKQLCDNPATSSKLKEQATKLLQAERVVQRRNEFLTHFTADFSDDSLELNTALQRFCGVVIMNKVNAFLDTAPQFLRDLLKNVKLRTIYRVHEDDVKVFHELEKVLDGEIFHKPLTDLAKRWIDRVSSSDPSVPILSPIYVSVCRSLKELIATISDSSDHDPQELLRSDQRGWHRLETAIEWKSVTELAGSLEPEYHFIFRLLNHFDPGAAMVGPFEYEAARPLERSIADELHVWFCLLDDVLRDHNLGPFEQIVTGFVQLLQKSDVDQAEQIRIVTHSVCRFVVQTSPIANGVQSEEDKQILQSQLNVINRAILDCANSLHDLLEVVTLYWKNRCKIVVNSPWKNSMLTIVALALRKNVDAQHVINLLTAINTFLVDMDGLSIVWLVKSLPEKPKNAAIALEYIEPVGSNKWSGTGHQAYRVIVPDKFHQLFAVLLDGAPCPRNYAIDVITQLLACVNSQLERDSGWSESDQIVSAVRLLTAIRVSLAHLHEQAEYVSYEQFLEDSVRPFSNAVERIQSLDEFCKRVGWIQESFQKMRRPNEISICQALRMYGELNAGDFSAALMQETYQRYRDHFETNVMMEHDSVDALVSSLREIVQSTHFEEWTHQFKQIELPKILAGVAAVWTVQRSAKPHCTQILAVLRLLGADVYKQGIPKHLAQIGAAQGKSLVLALVATVLALTGHRVQLVCFNELLAKRDANKFAELFEALSVRESVTYGTYADMVDAVIAPHVDGKAMELQTLVSDLVISQTGEQRPVKLKAQNLPVLLVDEVDVFFDKEHCEEVFCPGAFPVVPGLDQIQVLIWELVSDLGLQNVQEVMARIDSFMISPLFTKKEAFDTFLNNNKPFDLIVTLNATNYVRKQFTNSGLFHEELKPMIENAISVATDNAQHADFKLNQQGAITYRDEGGRFVTWSIPGYKSVFNYFRLKRHNFKLTVGSTVNYGYLNIGCGHFAYALLPTAFPLILAVTGSPLTTLNQHEKQILERFYNICQSSILPPSSGCSPFPFNPSQNFTHVLTKPLYMDTVFARAKAQADANRPVIIFFPTYTLLEEFRTLYGSRFDQVKVLTEKTPVDHVVCKAASRVTLATRGMGRAVDYGTGGDLHVIQTFFSVDVREEAQIWARTARMDAPPGSYELVVLDEHLRENGLVGADFRGTYAELGEARVGVRLRESEAIFRAMEQSEKNHFTTIMYLQSFFE